MARIVLTALALTLAGPALAGSMPETPEGFGRSGEEPAGIVDRHSSWGRSSTVDSPSPASGALVVSIDAGTILPAHLETALRLLSSRPGD